MPRTFIGVCAILLAFGAFVLKSRAGSEAAVTLPAATVDENKTAANGKETAVFAGGCFWGIQAVFQHIKGVRSATSGYSGGTVKNPSYETVSGGNSGHAESVQVVYDPAKITYGELLRVFFSVALDPTELNRQGPDEGTQYRSVLFYTTDEQKRIAEAYIAQLNQAKVFSGPIVTQVVPFQAFYMAEAYHQNYAALHPDDPYIRYNDAPKVENLKHEFPDLYAK
ncbi:MAG TPA: peptide-methionine (S)-S-oxide reductase MsrA [Candidatus Binatia bacterium]|nr:peptide-methionine (S)-S-oxide reductase MsrA [Candidatus Binatia bacterium]